MAFLKSDILRLKRCLKCLSYGKYDDLFRANKFCRNEIFVKFISYHFISLVKELGIFKEYESRNYALPQTKYLQWFYNQNASNNLCLGV